MHGFKKWHLYAFPPSANWTSYEVLKARGAQSNARCRVDRGAWVIRMQDLANKKKHLKGNGFMIVDKTGT